MAALVDVNALVALAWDSHVHHDPMRLWFKEHGRRGWATCAITEAGFVRISSNARILPAAISTSQALQVMAALRALPGHRFVENDVSITDDDVPAMAGHRQVTDAVLIALARRRGLRLLTFDAGIPALAEGRDIEVLSRGR